MHWLCGVGLGNRAPKDTDVIHAIMLSYIFLKNITQITHYSEKHYILLLFFNSNIVF